MPNVVIVGGALPDDVERKLSDAHSVTSVTREEFLRAEPPVTQAEGLILIGQPPVGAELLERLPRLRVVALRAVGYDKVDLAACARRGIVVCNTPEVLNRAVADLAVLHIVGALRGLAGALRLVDGGEWTAGAVRPALAEDPHGAVLGVVGAGGIGREVARICATGFGMQIAYCNRSGPIAGWDLPGPGRLPLPELLAISDVVSVHVPLTPATTGLIGGAELALMKPGSFLVNTSRGATVDEKALIEALRSGRLAGAGLDVLDPEPPYPDNPLLTMPNVMVTPHIGSSTRHTRRRMAELAAENILRVLSGQVALTPVEPSTPADHSESDRAADRHDPERGHE